MADVDKRWSRWAALQHRAAIDKAQNDLLAGSVDAARQVLEPLADAGEPASMTLLSQISHESEPPSEFERRQRRLVETAAATGFPPALYLLGYYYDEAELGYPLDKRRAALLFKRAAEEGHVQSQWIFALDLLNGTNGIQQDVDLGRTLLLRAYDAGLQRALESVAEFHRRGVFGFEKSDALATQIEAKAREAENWN